MKKILKHIWVVLTLFSVCSCGQKEAEVHKPIHWANDFTLKYLHVDEVRQLVAVQYLGGYEARVKLYVKSQEDGKTVWTKTLDCMGAVGKNGLGKTREGDMKTPIGDFGITTAFGILKNPGTSLPYIDVEESTWACGDTTAYNQIIDIRKMPHECTEGEHMIEITPEYNYGFALDYNKECTFGVGSAIFFHCTGAKPYTGGCIAVEQDDMKKILRTLDSHARIVIDYMP